MKSLALKMLIGNKASCLGVIFGIFMATLLVCQQSAIFLGLVSRSYRLVTDIPQPNLWVIDPATESDEKVRSFPKGFVDVIRGIPNIEWAVPINVAHLPTTTPSGIFHICSLYGLDDATLIGAPGDILEGNIADLHREGGVIIDVDSANNLMAKTLPDGTKVPLKVGDTFEINHVRAIVVAICKITQGFYPQPIIFSTLTSYNLFATPRHDMVDFIAIKARPDADMDKILAEINSHPLILGLTRDGLKWRIAKSFLQTGILINFGLSVILGIIVGFSIAGQIFYIITLNNLKYYALIKAIGGNEKQITRMILYQVGIVGIIGFLLGTGATLLWGWAIEGTSLAFLFPWQLLLFTAFITTIICLFTAGLSIRKVVTVEPKLLIGN